MVNHMRKTTIGLAGSVFLLCAGCTQRTEVAAAPEPPEPQKTVIRASTTPLAAEGSRTSFDEAAVLVWRTGDTFGLFSDMNAANAPYELDPASAGRTDGRFTGDRIEGTEFYAYYPYGAASFSGRTLHLTLPDVQQGVAGNFTQGQNPMVAAGSRENLYFRNLCGVVKLQITGTHTLAKVTFRGNNNEVVAGAATVEMDFAEAPDLLMAAEGSRTLTLDLGAGIALSEAPLSLYLVVPARTYAQGFTVTLTDTEGRSAVRTTTKPVTVDRARIKPMAPFEAEFLILWSDTEGLLTDVTTRPSVSATDLSAESANCYVISGPGTYKIPTRLTDGTRISDTEYIGFTASGAKGNAVVVIEDDAGTILWSWHIWCVNDLDLQGVPIGAHTYLDRNLGATATGPDSGEAAYGCFYQWGRKDPFPRNGLTDTQTLDQVALPMGRIYVQPSTATVAQTAAFPNVFFFIVDSDDWNTGHADDLWQQTSRTIFDPCPAGYEVPTIQQLENLVAQPLSEGTAGCTIAGVWFPTTGYCEAVVPVLQAVGSVGYGWSDHAFTSGSSRLFYLAQTYGTTATRAFASPEGIGYSRGYGLPVRCVRVE